MRTLLYLSTVASVCFGVNFGRVIIQELVKDGYLQSVVKTWNAIYALCKIVELRARKQ